MEGCRGLTKWKGVRSEVREIIGHMIMQGLGGHLKDYGFYSEGKAESLKGFEQGVTCCEEKLPAILGI